MQVLRDTFADLIGNCTFSAVTEEARDDYCENIRHAVCLRFEPTDVTIRCKDGTQTVRDFNSVNISLAESDHIDLMCGGESQFWRLTFAESDGHALALAADAAADAADDEYYWWYQTGAIESLGNHILFANDFFAANHDITAFGFDPAQRTACSLPLSCSTGAENADTQLLRAKRYLNTLLRLPFITATEKPLNMEDGMRCCTEIRFDAPQSFTLHNILEGDIQIHDAAALWIKPADTNEILYDLSRKDAAALRYDLYVLHEDDLKRDTGLLRECYTLDNRASEDMFLEEDLYYCFIKLFYPLK